MRKIGKPSASSISRILAVSGGADSVYLLFKAHGKSKSAILAHVNSCARGKESEQDQTFVERIGRSEGIPVEVRKIPLAKSASGFEKMARNHRYAFLMELKKKHGAEKILVGHTADDQVETILMRILEGAGISGLKGIPRGTDDGVERPLLDTWREDILEYLHKRRIPYRVDKSNFETRFERNWIRQVLIPLLEKRYGRPVKKRIFALGERFREIDDFLDAAARRWMKRNVKGEPPEAKGRGEEPAGGEARLRFRRKPYGGLPAALRKKVLQIACYERIGISPKERLLESMDRMIVSGGPSARLSLGKGTVLRNRYEGSILEVATGKFRAAAKKDPEAARVAPVALNVEEKGKIPAAGWKRLASGEQAAAFDADVVSTPFAVRPLREGDRIRPYGLGSEKKVKQILIDRKVPREERWGRPAVCDAQGRILWIPGVVRSSMAPVTRNTKRTMILRLGSPPE